MSGDALAAWTYGDEELAAATLTHTFKVKPTILKSTTASITSTLKRTIKPTLKPTLKPTIRI
jgi:hypothetical protein